jgi:hypothetical protein
MGDSKSQSLPEGLNKKSVRPRESPQHVMDSQSRMLRTSHISKWYFAAAYFSIAVFCYWGMWIKPAQYGLLKQLDMVLKTGQFPYDSTGSVPLKRIYIGIGAIDDIFVFLSAVYTSALVEDWDTSLRFMLLYFLGILIQPFAIWTVEGFRKCNQGTLLSL